MAIVGLGFLTLAAGCSKKAETTSLQDKLTVNDEKINKIISEMTLEEKVQMLHAKTIMSSEGVPRLGIAEIHYADGPFGVREELGDGFQPLGWEEVDKATYFPTGSALAATWSPELAYEYGKGLGQEARTRGKDMMLGPAINIQRVPVCGRSYEYLSEDPVLAGALAVSYVKGMQDAGTAVCVKHYAMNNQETNRGSVDVITDERTMRELYLKPFEAAVVDGGAMGIMPAYNRINGVFCSENGLLNNQILRDEWGFKGMTVSDWGGTHSTVEAALGGLDVQMPGDNYFGEALLQAVKDGKVPESVIDDKVRDILRVRFAIRAVPDDEANQKVASQKEGQDIAYKVAQNSIVLMKNDGKVLPLDKSKLHKIAVIGKHAEEVTAIGGIGAGVKTLYEISPLEGIRNEVGDAAEVVYAQGYNITRFKSWGYTEYIPRGEKEMTAEALAAAKDADVVIFVAGTGKFVESEGLDRKDIFLPNGQDALLSKIAEVNPNVVTVVISGGVCDLREVVKYSPAIVQGWWNGTEGGHALADVLFGKISPSGKLPFTWPLKLEDSAPYALGLFPQKQESGDLFTTQFRKDVENDDAKDYGEAGPPSDEHTYAYYEDKMLVGYRWYDTKKMDVMYPFGHGLSYTEFQYDNLSAKRSGDKIIVTFDVTNTGSVAGDEVAQLYVHRDGGSVEWPEQELKAFKRVPLAAGAKTQVKFEISSKDLSYWDVETHGWKEDPCSLKLSVGSSSRDIRLEQTL